MGCSAGPKITIKSPLLVLDARNPKSYNGTGNIWFDISGNGYNGSFVNSPTWSSNGGGEFLFNGSNQRIQTTLRYWGQNVTFSAWVKRDEDTTYYNMFMGRFLPYFSFLGNAQNFWSYYTTGVSQTVLYTKSLSNNVWYNFTYVITSDGSTSIMKNYTNGELDSVSSYNGSSINGEGGAVFNGAHATYDPGYYFSVGDGANFQWYPFKGAVTKVEVFNQAFTDIEVLNNFNAYKFIYGY